MAQHKYGVDSWVNKGPEMKQESVSTIAATVAAQEACEKWRLRLVFWCLSFFIAIDIISYKVCPFIPIR